MNAALDLVLIIGTSARIVSHCTANLSKLSRNHRGPSGHHSSTPVLEMEGYVDELSTHCSICRYTCRVPAGRRTPVSTAGRRDTWQ